MLVLTNFCVTFENFFQTVQKLSICDRGRLLAQVRLYSTKLEKRNIEIGQSGPTSKSKSKPKPAFVQTQTNSTFRDQYSNLEKPKLEQTRIIASVLTGDHQLSVQNNFFYVISEIECPAIWM